MSEQDLRNPRKREVQKDVLKKMIPDWYRCPLCNKILYGLMEWAAHTWQEHGIPIEEFEKKYGNEKNYFGTTWSEYFNPSKREE